MSRRSEHFVWIEISAIVGLLALLLVPLGILATEMMGGGRVEGGGGGGGGAPSVAGAHRPVPPSNGYASPQGGGSPLLGSRAAPAPPATEAPFSESWREQATPDLTGSASPSDGGGPGSVGGSVADRSGPVIASPRSFGGGSNGSVQTGNGRAGAGWQAEARQFSGRARALSNQLSQMAQPSPGGNDASTREGPETASASRPSASANSTAPGTPGDPAQAPIDDHVYWLAFVGVLWGVWRLWGT